MARRVEGQLFVPMRSEKRADIEVSVGKALREAREREGATLAKFAERLEISSANLCDLESGRRIPRPGRIVAIAATLGLDEAALLELSLAQLLQRERLDYSVRIVRNPTVAGKDAAPCIK